MEVATEPKPSFDADRFAPLGAVWVCVACGKISVWDKYGIMGKVSMGWDESCMINAMLCHEKPERRSLGHVTWTPFVPPTAANPNP